MRTILIPTDFSDNSWNAINYALEFFKYERCEFYLMHAYQESIHDQPNVTRESLDQVTSDTLATVQKQLEAAVNTIKETCVNPHYKFYTLAVNDILVEAADQIVEEENIDLIVMGTRGKTNDRQVTFGSQTKQVLKYVECPVLAIPENFTYNPPRHVLFPTNYLIPYKRREIRLVCDMLAPYRSTIDVIHIAESENLSLRQEDNQLFLKEILCKNPVKFKTIHHKPIDHGIQKYMENHPIDLLILVNSRHTFLESILFPNPLDKLTLELKIPFLALQNKTRRLHS